MRVAAIPRSVGCRVTTASSLFLVSGLVYTFSAGVRPALGGAAGDPVAIAFEVLLVAALGSVVAAAATVWRSVGSQSRAVAQLREEISSSTRRSEAAYRELEATNSRLKEFSFKDQVTGLYNRRFFSIRLEEEINRYRRFGRPLSVMLLDLDGFKAVNDRMGHAAGDETLRGVAHLLSSHSRDTNIICRFGGDEFAVLLIETTAAGARLFADRMRQLIARYPFAHGCPVSASVGLASVPGDVASSAEEIVRFADEALYAAKRAGKNTVSAHGDVSAERETAAAAGGRSS